MRRRTLLAPLLIACLLSPAPARAELPAAESKILNQVGETYRTIRRFLFEGSVRVDVRGAQSHSQDAPFFSAADGTGRLRDQVKGPAGGMIVSNGRETFIFNGTLGQYLRRAGSAESTLKAFSNRGVGSAFIVRYASIAASATSATRLPDESMTLEGEKRACVVLDVTHTTPESPLPIDQKPTRYWIDQKTHLVLRQQSIQSADVPKQGGRIEQEENVLFTRARLDPKLPDSLWVFSPPDTAKEVPEFKSGRPDEASLFAGKPAIDFTLADLKGRAHTLKDLRGKTVLLDFWATWCGPCRITMPRVAKIHEEYKARGVEVISINVGETAEKAGAYMTKNGYTFTTLLDIDRMVSTQYHVTGIPTLVVVDKEGQVSDYLVGVRDEAALRAALKKAGVQ